MQTNVNKWLPEYQLEVEAVKLGMRSMKATQEKLAKLHLNLSSTLPAIDSNVKRLLKFHDHQQRLSPVSEQQQKLLTNVLTGIDSISIEHAKEFRCATTQLPNQLSREKLCQVQEKMSQESMRCVYAIILRKLAADLQDYTDHYKFDGIFFEDVKKIELAITEEVKPLPTERLNCNWEVLMREKICTIDVAQMVKTSANDDHVKIVVASQSSTILQQCSSKLKDETLDLEFQETKRCLKQAWDRLEMTLIKLNSGASITFK
jgi:hypothetical protein